MASRLLLFVLLPLSLVAAGAFALESWFLLALGFMVFTPIALLTAHTDIPQVPVTHRPPATASWSSDTGGARGDGGGDCGGGGDGGDGG